MSFADRASADGAYGKRAGGFGRRTINGTQSCRGRKICATRNFPEDGPTSLRALRVRENQPEALPAREAGPAALEAGAGPVADRRCRSAKLPEPMATL